MNETKIGKEEELTIQRFKEKVESYLARLESNLISLINGLLNEGKEELKQDEIISFTDMAFVPFLKFSYTYATKCEQRLKVLYNFIICTDESESEEEGENLTLSELDLNLAQLNNITRDIDSKIDALAKYFGLTYEVPLPTDYENPFRYYLELILYHLQNAIYMSSLINDYIKFEKLSLEEDKK